MKQRFDRNPAFSVEDWMGQTFQGIRGSEPVEVAIQFDEYQDTPLKGWPVAAWFYVLKRTD